jgi:hypothetical protein
VRLCQSSYREYLGVFDEQSNTAGCRNPMGAHAHFNPHAAAQYHSAQQSASGADSHSPGYGHNLAGRHSHGFAFATYPVAFAHDR